MHMADALLSPAVGGVMWTVTAGVVVYCSKKVKEEAADWKIPLMGVLGAFVFAAQMINFTIPGTGSSGHLVGSLLLAILLGPHAAFLTIASVLTVQALFFADGGVRTGVDVLKLLALGADAVLVGRPLAVGACGAGPQGVQCILEKMTTELKQAMILTGCADLESVNARILSAG